MIIDMASIIQFGTKVTAHGQEWIKIQPVGIDCFLAVKADEKDFPAQVYLIRPERSHAS